MGSSVETVLVLNAGSSSLKYELFATNPLASLEGATLAVESKSSFAETTRRIVSHLASRHDFSSLQGVGHRVVHGGLRFSQPAIVDDSVEAEISNLSALAPLHNPSAVAAIKAIDEDFPNLSQVAVFDTAFFSELPPSEQVYPLPYEWFENLGIRRFGFHGISHSYCARKSEDLLNTSRSELKLVVCHLGNGCSATAIEGGKPVSTTMGFTPMEGLMMGGRSGSIDPGILFHVLKNGLFSVEDLDAIVNKASGLLGVSGVSSDFRDVQKAADLGVERACLAIEMFANKVRSAIGALAARLGGLDAIIFTGGIGENAPRLRREICDGLVFLGCQLDYIRNEESTTNGLISEEDSPVQILVIRSSENQEIATETIALLGLAQ